MEHGELNLRRQHRQFAYEVLARMTKALTMSRNEISSCREHALRAAIHHARERSGWHGARLAHVDLKANFEQMLAAIPIMTKRDLIMNWNHIITSPDLDLLACQTHAEGLGCEPNYLNERYTVVKSGGSSGNPCVIAYDWDELAIMWASATRWYLQWHSPPKRGATRIGAVGADRAMHATAALRSIFASPFTTNASFPVTEGFASGIVNLQRFQPDILIGYPSAIRFFASAALKGDLFISPRVIITTSEILMPEARRVFKSAWTCLVVDTYGVSEFGNVAHGCGHCDAMHVNEDLFVIEPVDSAYRPIPAGTQSNSVLITALHPARLLPLFRYEITDRVILQEESQSCPCGSNFQQIGKVHGRSDDIFHYGGVAIHAHVFESVFGQFANILEYRVVQKSNGIIVDVHVDGHFEPQSLADALRLALGRAGFHGANIEIRSVPEVERTNLGKLRRFVAMTP